MREEISCAWENFSYDLDSVSLVHMLDDLGMCDCAIPACVNVAELYSLEQILWTMLAAELGFLVADYGYVDVPELICSELGV